MDALLFAWRNLWHNRRRTLITLAAVSLTLMLTQAMHNLAIGSYQQMIYSGVRSGSGHLTVYHTQYRQDRSESLSFARQPVEQMVHDTIPALQSAPRIYLSALAQSSYDSRAVALTGIDMSTESTFNPYLKKLPADEFLRPDERRDALVGEKLCRELKLRPGQKLVVTLQNAEGEMVSELLRIRGILRTGVNEVDSGLIMINLTMAQKLLGRPGHIHELALLVDNDDTINDTVATLANQLRDQPQLEVVPWQVAMPNLADAIRLDYASQNVILVIMMVIVTIGIVNTLLMSVMERIHEFGIMLAVGAGRGRLVQLVACEASLLGILSAIIGTCCGSLLTWYLAIVGIDLRDFMSENMEFGGVVFDPIMRAAWDPLWMTQTALYIILLCLIAALYPAWKATRLLVVDAIRHH